MNSLLQTMLLVLTHRAMVLLDWMQVNVFEVVSRPFTADRISLLHSTVRTKHQLSSVEMRIQRTKSMIEDLLYNLSIVDLMFLHSSCFSMSFKVVFRRNGKKGNKNTCKIWRLWSNRQVDVSETQINWLFILVARTVCKMCLVWTAE
jgi:hypothetical protein